MNQPAAPTTVALISSEGALYRLCRDIGTELAPNRFRVIIASQDAAELPPADYYIWDVNRQSSLAVEAIRSSPERHLMIADAGDLNWVSERCPVHTAILLKPVTRRVLRAFLEWVLQAAPEPAGERQRVSRLTLVQALIQASLDLQRQQGEYNSLVASVAHDFRVPLSAITGYCGLLMRGDAGEISAQQRQILERLDAASRRLDRLAAGVLHLSTGERAPAPELAEHNISDCIQQAISECRAYLADRNVQVTTSVEPAPWPLVFDRCEIERVLINLLENASKHGPRNGRIEIRAWACSWERRAMEDARPGGERRLAASEDPNAYRIDVMNSSAVAPPPEAERIRQERINVPRPEPKAGTGLGLAICKSVLERHQGAFWSESSGMETRYSFVLPLRSTHPTSLEVPSWPAARSASAVKR